MNNLIESHALFEILKSPIPSPHIVKGNSVGDEPESGVSGGAAVQLNVNAQEFIPRCKVEHSQTVTDEGIDADLVSSKCNEPKLKTKLTLPWKGFPKKSEKASRTAQVVLLNDVDYMIVPRIKRVKKTKDETKVVSAEAKPTEGKAKLAKNDETTPSEADLQNALVAEKRVEADEKRRQQERKVALEALKLVEQRRLRGPLVGSGENTEESEKANLIIHLSRSPVQFSPEERIRVDRLRIAKKERIERVLREMKTELEAPQVAQVPKQKKSPSPPKTSSRVRKRYIPTTKEWDEKCREKLLATIDAADHCTDPEDKNWKPNLAHARMVEPLVSSTSYNIMPTQVIKLEDAKAAASPRFCPPARVLQGEQRKGNLTYSRHTPPRSPRSAPQGPMKTIFNKSGKIIQRYTIDQLLKFEPQPGQLEKPNFLESATRLGFLCD
nr:serine/threonine-protein phosphatase 4 regulatory subunit 2 [Drosophila bipectinata]